MSKVKIQGNASGTGVLTITAPNTSTDRTITLPDTTGTLLDENSSVPAANLTGTVADARFPATLPAASAANLTAIPAANITGTLPAISGANLTNIDGGKVAQVVEGRRTGVATYNVSQTWTAIGSGNNGLNLDITPSATSSKILLTAHVNLAAHSGQRGGISFFRDSTQIGLGDANGSRQKSHMHYTGKIDDTTSQEGLAISFLDSPNSTSSITYTLKFWHENATNVVINQAYSSNNDSSHLTGVSSITAMEILA
jgi:hypothetical protein